MRQRKRRVAGWTMLVVLCATGSWALPGIPNIPGLPGGGAIQIPGFEDIVAHFLREDPAVTTSLDDAAIPMPSMDDYEPEEFQNGAEMPRDESGSWILPPGAYQFDLESYCLHAGSHGPGGGEGYLLAPLKGSRADIIGAILRHTWRHPDLDQTDVQMLIWSIQAGISYTRMPTDMQAVARKLLDKDLLRKLSGKTIFDQLGGPNGIPDEVIQRVIDKLPAPAREAFELHARIYNLAASGNPTFEQFEELAMRTGTAPGGAGEVPLGRWSWDQAGHFVRYFPSSYQQTVMQVLVPPAFNIVRDELHRIAGMMDEDGWGVATLYDDTIEPFTDPDLPGLIGYAFRQVRFTQPDPEDPEVPLHVDINLDEGGWTYVYRPEAAVRQAAWMAGPVLASWAGDGFAWRPTNFGWHYAKRPRPSAKEAYEAYKKGKELYDKVDTAKKRATGQDDGGLDVVDTKKYIESIEDVAKGNPLGVAQEQAKRVARGFEHVNKRLLDEVKFDDDEGGGGGEREGGGGMPPADGGVGGGEREGGGGMPPAGGGVGGGEREGGGGGGRMPPADGGVGGGTGGGKGNSGGGWWPWRPNKNPPKPAGGGGVAAPGNRARQRLGMSQRTY